MSTIDANATKDLTMEPVGKNHPLNKLKAKPKQSTAEKNAADWTRPGGGYAEWKKGDAAREKRLPIGGTEPVDGPKKPWSPGK
jgi:hypothetical protein